MENHILAYGAENLPLRISGLELQCYMLADTRGVITKTSLQKALGYEGKSQEWLFDLLSSINKFYPVPGVVFDALEDPIVANGQQLLVPDVVQEICKTILNAKKDGFLGVGQLRHARAAALIAAFFEQHDVQYAIQEATGYHFAKDTGLNFLRDYLIRHDGDLVYRWLPALRDDLWEKLFYIHHLDWSHLRRDPKHVAGLLYECLFCRLSAHLLDVLRRQTPKRIYRKSGKPTGNSEHPELRQLVSEILSLLAASGDNWIIFMQLLNRVHPRTGPAVLHLPDALEDQRLTSGLDVQLAKAVSVNRIYHKNHKKRA